MYQLSSHNLSITPEVTHYDSNGNKVKTISYPKESIAGEDSNIELTLYNSDGNIKDYFKIPFRSFTQAFARVIMSRSFIAPGSNINIPDTGGSLRTAQAYYNMLGYSAPAPATTYTYGILVNSSGSSWATSSVAHTGSFSQANGPASGIIAHGTGIGSMSYAIQTFDTGLTEISGSWMFSTSRVFTNNSVANINIKEIDFVSQTYPNSYKILIARELKDSNGNDINVTVAPAQVLTVKYNIYAPSTSGIHRNLLAYMLSEMRDGASIANSVNIVYSDVYVLSALALSGFNNNYMTHNTGVNVVWNGIMVGKGTTTESLDILGPTCQWILHGSSSADQLRYGANNWDGAQYVFSTSGSSLEWNIKRTFTNGFADPITVNEAMIVASMDSTYDNNSKTSGNKFIAVRKLIGAQTIASGSSLEVNFKFMIEA
jgi:hypothetical protein